MLKTLDNRLNKYPNDKYFTGNKLTVYDIFIAGFFFNVILNPAAIGSETWKKGMAEHSTERVNQFLNDFKNEFKNYLENRPKPSIY